MSYEIPAQSFLSPSGSALVFRVAGVPSGFIFDGKTLSGTPTEEADLKMEAGSLRDLRGVVCEEAIAEVLEPSL